MDTADVAPLVVRFGRLGDMVLLAPLLRILHRRYGQPTHILTVGSWASELYAGSPDVAGIRQLRSRHTPFALSPERWRLVAWLSGYAGPIYVGEESPRQVAKIRRWLRYAGVPASRSLFLTDLPQQDRHWVDRLLCLGNQTPPAFTQSIGAVVGSSDGLYAPQLPVHAADRTDCTTWLNDRGFAGRPIVLLQPGHKHASKAERRRDADDKAWPATRWAALLLVMRSVLPNAVLLLCGSASETALLTTIQDCATGVEAHVVSRELSLRRLLALMEIAHSMVSVDTGPAHMAAAVGCPLVVLYGSESHEVWGRRSPTGSPIVELSGAEGSAGTIPFEEVADAWSRLARLGGIMPQ